MTETLLTPSSVKLYGRVLNDLAYKDDTPAIGANNFLHQQLAAKGTIAVIGTTAPIPGGGGALSPTVTNVSSVDGLLENMPVNANNAAGAAVFDAKAVIAGNIKAAVPGGAGASFDVNPVPLLAAGPITINAMVLVQLARIYAFSFEGAIYGMPKPAIFVVHGPGTPINFTGGPYRSNVDQSGVVAREWEFASKQVLYWEYEKGDFSLRLDTEAGPLEQILLAAAIRGADMADRSGANLGIRSGANLSGANLSGANLSGANLSGANLRNR
ncbi:MAG: pentapeptide repeat-containing protein [Hyphomicrobiales bacterium]|nr:pentapeptide repeat-containing protein [Hyphomicrobiales bacterium]